MKKFILLFALILASTHFVCAQDTLVRNNGVILAGYIAESDSSTVTISGLDTTEKQFQLFSIKNLLMIKHRDGRAEKFFANDTLITMEGSLVMGKILEITPDYVSIFTYNGKVNNVMMISKDAVFMLRMNDGTSETIDHNENLLTDEAAYRMGAEDAGKYYHVSKGAKAGSVFMGMETYMYGIGLVGEIAIAKGAPKNLHTMDNPNDQLLNTNMQYHNGYETAATKMKKKACWKNYAAGVIAPLALVALAAGLIVASYE